VSNFSAIAMLEYTSISAGIEAADSMTKAANISPLFFKTICPGKFLAGVSGEIGAVKSSVRAACQIRPEAIADWLILPNIHHGVITALGGCVTPKEEAALGVIETFSVASAIAAADTAVKAADIQILDIRTALGLGGKGYVLLSGQVGAIKTSVAAGEEKAKESGLLVGSVILPRPSASLLGQLL
jgi:microcompartment protein CcmL/EutN